MRHLALVGLGIFVAGLLTAPVKAEDVQVKKGDVPERFAKADTDGDGKLSLAEFKAAFPGDNADKKFANADTDKDGFVTPEELKAAHSARLEKFAKADTNGDGKLSLTEFKAAFPGDNADKKFTAADTDKDGFVTLEELKAAHGAKPAQADAQ